MMKATIAALLLAFATTASATWGGDTNYDYDTTYNTTNNTPKAYGGKGGDANVTNSNTNNGYVSGYNRNDNRANASSGASAGAVAGATGGDASAQGGDASAYGGTVYSSNRNTVQGGRNDQGQRQSQNQSQRNANSAVGTGNTTTTSVQVDGDTYEAPKKADVPAYAPNVIASPATAPCYVTFGGSGGVSGMFSIGGAGFVKDHGCAFGEVARRAAAVGNQAIADEALGYMMDIVKADAGVDQPVETDVPVFQSETAPQDDVLWYAK